MSKEELIKRRNEIFDSLDTKIKEQEFQCTVCCGKGSVVFFRNLKINDCICCEGSGSRIIQLLFDIEFGRIQEKDLRQEVVYLTNFIKSTSTCKTCGGNREKTFGGGTCNECGIEGNGPWPG